MSNIFIRTNIAPYRIDTYNALHERMGMVMCFYNRVGNAQNFDVDLLETRCSFEPHYLKGLTLGRSNRKLCFGLWKMLRREKPSIVIVPEFQISAIQVLLYRWLTRGKFKVVSMTDDSYDMIENGNDFSKIHAWLRNHIAKYFDGFIVVTPEVERWYQKRYNKGIWLPIVMDDATAIAKYERIMPISITYREHYNLFDKKILLYVGRLVDLKNLYRVVDAFASSECDATLVIVGDGPERNQLEEYSKHCKKEVVFTGRFDGDELYAWYNLASVFILASYKEPFGAVTNEALLAGCRVIISQKAGSSCLVEDSNGELIDPMDIDGIANAIDRQMALASVPNLMTPRRSLMTITFEDRINILINRLQ